jgi:hypothetical protein
MVPRPDRADVVTMGRPGFPCSAVRPRGFPRPSMMTRRVLSLRGRDIPARGAGSCRAGSGLPLQPTATGTGRRVADPYANSKPCSSNSRGPRQSVPCGERGRGPGDRVFSRSRLRGAEDSFGRRRGEWFLSAGDNEWMGARGSCGGYTGKFG